MRRKSLLVFGLVLLLAGGTLAVLVLLICHEPAFYRDKDIAPGEVRTKKSKAFVSNFWQLLNGIMNQNDTWQATFTEAQINSYFAEEFIRSRLANVMLPEGVCEPRVAIERAAVRLGFRYGTPPWSTVISVVFRVWMAPGESNVVILQLQEIRAGALPISSKMLMEKAAEAIRSQNRDIEVSWFRHQGKVTALLRFGSNRPRSPQLQQLKLGPGILHIAGRSPTDAPPHANPPTPQAQNEQPAPDVRPVVLQPAAHARSQLNLLTGPVLP